MTAYLGRRLGVLGVVMFGIAVFAFLLTYVVPADPVLAVVGPRASAETYRSVRKEMGLDDPLPVQFGRYLVRLSHLDLGTSFVHGAPVRDMILERFPATLQLAVAGVLLEVLIGIPLGVMSALRHNQILDRVTMVGLILGLSSPGFWTGLILLYAFGFLIPILPLGGFGEPKHLVLPALTIGITGAAWYGRLIRSSMLEILSSDYIRTARAKGIREAQLVWRHAIPNAVGPALTIMGLDLGTFMGGVIAIEQVFAWPGIGHQAFDAITTLDVPVVTGTVIFGSFFVLLMNLVVDVVQGLVDPRISYT